MAANLNSVISALIESSWLCQTRFATPCTTAIKKLKWKLMCIMTSVSLV